MVKTNKLQKIEQQLQLHKPLSKEYKKLYNIIYRMKNTQTLNEYDQKRTREKTSAYRKRHPEVIHAIQNRHNRRKNLQGFRQFIFRVEDELKENIKSEIIDGLLLGDASVTTTKFVITQAIRSKDFVLYIKEYLESLGFTTHFNLRFSTAKGKHYEIADLATHVSRYFKLLRIKWYPDGKKIVPHNLILTPKIIAYWFMCDGSTTWINNKKQVRVNFATNGFTKNDVLILLKNLHNFGLINARITNYNKRGYEVIIAESKNVKQLMQIIEPYIHDCFKYKIKYPN